LIPIYLHPDIAMDLYLFPVFLIGLLGSVHCIGMCGGIVSALSVAGDRKRIPISIAGKSGQAFPVMAMSRIAVADDALRVLAYNTGRIASYATAGAIAGGVAQGVRTLAVMSSLQIGAYWFANLMLIALGLYLMDAWRGLARLESIGHVVWRRVQPLVRHFLPMDNPGKAFALGALWGWVPCGMVYSVLLTAMLSGSAASGALTMVAFGAGTLPVLLTVGMFGSQVQAWSRQRKVRIAAGLIVLGFGVLGLVRATHGLPLGGLESLCITPPAHQGLH
jgi:uncharacterized protein